MFAALQTPRSLTLRFTWGDVATFWLVGGLSIVFLGVVLLAGPVTPQGYYQASWIAFYIAFLVNNPHFAHSYQLFYAQFAAHLRDPQAGLPTKARFIVCGALVPLALVAWFAAAYAARNPAMVAHAVVAMFFLVGWHYVKQGYGVLITLSARRGIYYEPLTKRVLTLNVYMVWIYALIRANGVASQHRYYDIPYTTFDLPDGLAPLALAAIVATGGASLALLLREWIVARKPVCINGLTGYIAACYLWTAIPYINPLYFLFVPLFHSLQYMPFVYSYKSGQIALDRTAAPAQSLWRAPPVRLIAFALTGIALGAVFMDLAPKHLDGVQNAHAPLFTQNFFLMTFLLFINIHHYFIDHAFWRRDNRTVQTFLFRRPDPPAPR